MSGIDVSIRMATKNGGRFLAQQLASLLGQEGVSWDLTVSDDGSTDATKAMLERFAQGRSVAVMGGPQRGFARNFQALAALPLHARHLAFCDQDDVWASEKLLRAVRALQPVPRDTPALYCGRTVLVDDALKPLGCSPLFARKPGFANALVQSIAGGNTMVLNPAAADLMARHARAEVVSHDWWAYQLVSGAGGVVFYDPQPWVFYRQHGDNVSGANLGGRAGWVRAQAVLAGRYRRWLDIQSKALRGAEGDLTPQSLRLLDRFDAARARSGWACAFELASSGIYRQRLAGQASLLGAALVAAL
ncbi:MAG: glycosyltransferase [Pseudomonadota bacterium]